jgi:NAD-dependent DNA ligase
MSLKIHGTTENGRPVRKECPICGSPMEKQEKCTDGVLWQCRNDDCAHQEEA